MPHRIAPALVAVLLAIVALRSCSFQNESKQREREAAYQAALKSYMDVLKVGITRKEVEDYLQMKGVEFQRECCPSEKSAFADLIKIGKEEPPWFCDENFVYVEFDFVDEMHVDWRPSRQSSDRLKRMSVYHQLGGCL